MFFCTCMFCFLHLNCARHIRLGAIATCLMLELEAGDTLEAMSVFAPCHPILSVLSVCDDKAFVIIEKHDIKS